jgi:hypothetical protein
MSGSPEVDLFSEMGDRKVITTHRMLNEVEQRRLWSEARGRDTTPWYARTYQLKSRAYLAASNAVMLCSLVDICIMMLDGIGYEGCSLLCHEHGGRFSRTSVHFRGHLGESFRAIKIALGIPCDLMYLMYLGMSFRTVLFRCGHCFRTITSA